MARTSDGLNLPSLAAKSLEPCATARPNLRAVLPRCYPRSFSGRASRGNYLKSLARPARFERAAFAFGGRRQESQETPGSLRLRARSAVWKALGIKVIVIDGHLGFANDIVRACAPAFTLDCTRTCWQKVGNCRVSV